MVAVMKMMMMMLVQKYLLPEKTGTIVAGIAGIAGAAPAGIFAVDENDDDLWFVFFEMMTHPTASSSISYSSSS